MLVPVLAVLVSRLGVLLRLVVLADIVQMGGLMMMMSRRVMMSGRLKMMLACGMQILRHGCRLSLFEPPTAGTR